MNKDFKHPYVEIYMIFRNRSEKTYVMCFNQILKRNGPINQIEKESDRSIKSKKENNHSIKSTIRLLKATDLGFLRTCVFPEPAC